MRDFLDHLDARLRASAEHSASQRSQTPKVTPAPLQGPGVRQLGERSEMHPENTDAVQAQIDALDDAEVLRRAEAIGFVREPTIAWPEATWQETYGPHEAEDAAEARKWIDLGARFVSEPPNLRPIDARRWLAFGACFPMLEQA